MKLKFLVAGLVGLSSLTTVAVKSHADSLDFSVEPTFPSTQVANSQGYFNLLLKPGQTQEVDTKLTNNSDKAITVEVNFARATTANSGIAQYQPSQNAADKSLTYDISKYVKYPKEVTIPAKAGAIVKAEVNMPSEAFKGELAGGFTYQEKDSSGNQSSSAGVTVKNEFSYTIALVMQQSMDKVPAALNLNAVKADQSNGRNIITANLQNPAAAYLLKMNTQATVTGISDKSLKYTYNNSAMQMAPNSNFDLPIPVSITGNPNGQSSQPMKAGKYHLNMVVYGNPSAAGKYSQTVNGQTVKYDNKWTFDKDFEITAQKASSLNATDPTVKKSSTSMWIWIAAIIGIVIILLLIVIIIILIKKSKKEEK